MISSIYSYLILNSVVQCSEGPSGLPQSGKEYGIQEINISYTEWSDTLSLSKTRKL